MVTHEITQSADQCGSTAIDKILEKSDNVHIKTKTGFDCQAYVSWYGCVLNHCGLWWSRVHSEKRKHQGSAVQGTETPF